MKILLLLSFFLGTASPLKADVISAPNIGISYEQEPSNLDWRIIRSPHFEIIFPKEVEETAQRVTHLLEKAYPFVSRSLEVQPEKIPVILHNQSMTSNGFVTLAPRRSEWYLTPAVSTELSNTDWLKTLAIHEFRHVVQFQKSKQGFNRVYQVLFGQIGEALGIGLTMPQWFLEGDAVGIETALTVGGRGRLPIFERDLRAILLSGKNWSYDKSYFGSYKDYVPNHYVYGYFLTTWFRNQFGDLALSKIVDDAADRSWNPLTFYHAVERITDKNFEDLFKTVMQDLMLEWTARSEELKLTPYEVMNLRPRKVWTNYFYPQALDNGKVFALKRGLGNIPEFILLDGKKEHSLYYPASLQENYPFQVRNNRFAFFEVEIDPRWGFRDYSKLKVFDLNNEEFIYTQSKTKGRLAVLNGDGSKVLFVSWDQSQKQTLVVQDLTGKVLTQIDMGNVGVITSLDWLSDTEVVFVYKDDNDEKSVQKINLETSLKETLVNPSPVNIGAVIVSDGEILIESSSSGVDNIFHLNGKDLKQLTSSLYGAYAPQLKNGELIYNDYSYDGMNIVRKKLEWNEEQKSEDSFYPFYEKFARSENASALQSELLEKESFSVEKYSKTKNALNFHSWILMAPPLSSIVSLAAISRDDFNTFALVVGTDYHVEERTLQGYVSTVWSNYYPVFDLRAAYGGRRTKFISGKETTWDEGSAEGGVSIPWNYLSGRFTHSFSLRGFSKLLKVTNKNHAPSGEIRNGDFLIPGGEFSYSLASRLSRRDLYPELGFTLQGRFEEGHDISGQREKGRRSLLDGRLYLPGLMKHHSFYHQLAYEKQDAKNYEFSSFVLYPRGTERFFLDELHKYSGNYTFPLFYPDWNLYRYIYFKRISANLFYDELHGRVSGFEYFASSAGWEVLTEMNILRIFVPLTIGVRGSYPIKGIESKENYEVFLASTYSLF